MEKLIGTRDLSVCETYLVKITVEKLTLLKSTEQLITEVNVSWLFMPTVLCFSFVKANNKTWSVVTEGRGE